MSETASFEPKAAPQRGRTIITAEGKLTDSRGRLLAHGTSTLIVLRKEGPKAGDTEQ